MSQDKFMMKDPATANCRIYIGNIPDNTAQDELYDIFKDHGDIAGILINKGFGFIQFEEEQSAQDAIKEKNGHMLHGRNLIVRTAMQNAKQLDKNKEGGDSNASSQDNQSQEPAEAGPPGAWREAEEAGRGGRARRGRGARGGPRERDGPNGPRERSPLRLGGRPGQKADWGNGRDRGFGGPERYPLPVPVTDRNDCEIIVVSKALTEYAEYIESRLKRHGIVVDLLFPKEDVPIGRVLGNIRSRGCLYAILIMPQNEEHRSLTLNILHGLPQEHRHMPLDDAMSLISRNFNEYRSGVATASSREAILALLRQLADGRALTVLQYDRVIEYLKEKRELQLKMELGDAAEPSKETSQSDLQQMILSMLNNEAPEKPKDTEVSDPTIQKALDSFLQKLV